MSENRFKEFDTPSEEPKRKSKVSVPRLFSWNKADKYLRFVIFLVVIGLVYIWNAHMAEKQVRKKDDLNREIRELKSEYTTLNADMSFGTRQSEIAEIVDTLGLSILVDAPYALTDKNEQ